MKKNYSRPELSLEMLEANVLAASGDDLNSNDWGAKDVFDV